MGSETTLEQNEVRALEQNEVRALIVEDHSLFAEAVRGTLEARGIRVVDVAPTGAAAIEAVARYEPDVVLLDLGLPDRSGLAVGSDIVAGWPHVKVLALTALDDPSAVKEALRLGLHGYVTKDIPAKKFVGAVLAALEGQVVVPHRLASRAVEARSSPDGAVAFMADQLTYRELDVLGLLAEGVRGEEIATRLSISRNTVRTHVQNILTKLQVHSRLEAATFAVRHGIVDPPRASSAS